MGGSKVRGIELVELGNGELIVNVTEYTELAEVTDQLSRDWEWEALTGPTVQPGEDGEDPTEWLTLLNAKRKVVSKAA